MAPAKRKRSQVSTPPASPHLKHLPNILALLDKLPNSSQVLAAFRRLPTKKQVPDYFDVIKKPVSLTEITKNAPAFDNESTSDEKGMLELEWLLAQFQQMWENAVRYNGTQSPISASASLIVQTVRDYIADVIGSDAETAEGKAALESGKVPRKQVRLKLSLKKVQPVDESESATPATENKNEVQEIIVNTTDPVDIKEEEEVPLPDQQSLLPTTPSKSLFEYIRLTTPVPHTSKYHLQKSPPPIGVFNLAQYDFPLAKGSFSLLLPAFRTSLNIDIKPNIEEIDEQKNISVTINGQNVDLEETNAGVSIGMFNVISGLNLVEVGTEDSETDKVGIWVNVGKT